MRKIKLRLAEWFVLDWKKLKSLMDNRFVKSSAIWLVITPIAAKSLEGVNSINFDFMQGPVLLALPFSWTCFFFAALLFAVSNAVYRIWCPDCIKNYSSLSDFKQKDYTESHIRDLFVQGLPVVDMESDSGSEKIKDLRLSWGVRSKIDFDLFGPEEGPEIHEIIAGNKDNAFMALRSLFSKTSPVSRFLATILFYFGSIFMLIVLTQNIIFVIQQF